MTATTESARQPDDCRVSQSVQAIRLPLDVETSHALRDEPFRRSRCSRVWCSATGVWGAGPGPFAASTSSHKTAPSFGGQARAWLTIASILCAGHVTGRALRRSTAARRGAPACSSAANTASWRCQGNHPPVRSAEGQRNRSGGPAGGSHGRRLQVRCIPVPVRMAASGRIVGPAVLDGGCKWSVRRRRNSLRPAALRTSLNGPG